MTSLKNFNNLFANVAESAYADRPRSFSEALKRQHDGVSAVAYSKNATSSRREDGIVFGGKNLPNKGTVYLQQDNTAVQFKLSEKIPVTDEISRGLSYEIGLMTNGLAGFNSYLLTDTTKLDRNTKNVYLAIRGSDGLEWRTVNDWVDNDANFAITNSYLPQSKLAYQAEKQTLKKMSQDSPNAKLNIAGHSLGTMVSAQSIAKLYHDDPKSLNQIGRVVLFDGPDVTKSLRKMGLSTEEIKKIGEKVTYYVNPLDIVSMLNRTAPTNEQFGHVNYIVPLDFGDTFASKNSAHDFGEYQIDDAGKPLVASSSFHPEMLTAGKKLAKLIQEMMAELGNKVSSISQSDLLQLIKGGVASAPGIVSSNKEKVMKLVAEFKNKYAAIVKEARQKAVKFDEEHIGDFQAQIAAATGGKKIALRQELLQMVAQIAMIRGEDRVNAVKRYVKNTRQKITDSVNLARHVAVNMGSSLSVSELGALMDNFRLSTFWDEAQAAKTVHEAQKYQKDLAQFAQTLMKAGQGIEEADSEGAKGFDRLMKATINNWGK